MDIRLSSAIITIPRRRSMVSDLLAELPDADVYLDDQRRGPWWNARQAWLGTPEWATHRLVLQDDVMLCRDFLPGVLAVLAAKPNAFVSLVMSMPQLADYLARGDVFMPYLGPYGQAAILPAAWAYEFVEWADDVDFDALPDTFFITDRLPARQPHDDGLLFHWLYETGHEAVATVPSLAYHLRGQSSLGHEPRPIPRHPPMFRRFVENGAVKVVPDWYWIGHERSPLDIDWNKPCDLSPT